jgi:hypothetical protein
MVFRDIVQFLNDEGVGVWGPDTTATIFANTLPDQPNDCIYIRPTQGTYTPGYTSFEVQGIQVLVRGVDKGKAYDKARLVFNTLHGQHDRYLIDPGRWVTAIRAFPPGYIGTDAKGRHEYSINMTVEYENLERGTAE